MDRINKVGRALIGYKSEYGKHYSPIVDESLMIALETQLEKRLLDQEIFDMIINDSISIADFENFIGTKREYVKSQKELLEEFEKVRGIVNEALTNINFVEFIETESNTEINKISVLRQYSLSKDFIMIYFGLEEEDMPQIMKKKGFAEKFAVLRLTKVFKEIFSEMRPEIEFTQGFSRVYYNPDIEGFSVDYKYHLPVDFISKDNIESKVKKIRDTDRVVERKFLKKTGIGFYNVKDNQKTNETLNVSKKAPNNKFTEVNVKEEELSKIKDEVKNEQVEEIKETKAPIKEQEVPKQEQKNDNRNKPNNNPNNRNDNNSQKQSNPRKEEKKETSPAQTDDYLDKNVDLGVEEVDNPDNVLEIVDNLSSMVIEEDYSGDFTPTNFEGFIPDDSEIDMPDMEFPEIDELGDIDVDMPLDDEDDDV